MKRLIVATLFALVALGVGPEPLVHIAEHAGLTLAADAQQDPAATTVYVTRTGQKYHRDGCRYLSSSMIPMSLKEAALRYTACSVCKPPVMK